MRRMISISSRVRRSGRSNATPSQASMICGVLVPSPSTKRSPVIDASAIAVPAVSAGLRTPIFMMLVPRRTREVWPAT